MTTDFYAELEQLRRCETLRQLDLAQDHLLYSTPRVGAAAVMRKVTSVTPSSAWIQQHPRAEEEAASEGLSRGGSTSTLRAPVPVCQAERSVTPSMECIPMFENTSKREGSVDKCERMESSLTCFLVSHSSANVLQMRKPGLESQRRRVESPGYPQSPECIMMSPSSQREPSRRTVATELTNTNAPHLSPALSEIYTIHSSPANERKSKNTNKRPVQEVVLMTPQRSEVQRIRVDSDVSFQELELKVSQVGTRRGSRQSKATVEVVEREAIQRGAEKIRAHGPGSRVNQQTLAEVRQTPMRIPLSSSLPTTEQVILVDVSPSVCEGSPAPRSLRRASRRKDSTNEPAATQAAPRELETCFVRGVVRRDSRQSRSITYQIESAAEVSPCDVEKTQIHETPLNNSCVKDSTVKAIAVKKSPQESETSAVHGAVPARLQRPRSASGRIEAEELLSSAEPVVVHPITVATPRNQETSVKNQSKKNLSRKRCTPMEISQLMKGPPVSPQVADTRNSVRKSPMNLDDVGDLMVEVEMSFLDSSKAVQRAPMRKDCLKDDAKDGVSSSLLSEVMRCGDPNKVDDRGVLDVGAAPAPLSEPPKQPSDSQMEQTRLRAHQRKHSVRPVLDMKLHNQNLDRSTEEKCHTHPVATNEPIDERLSPRPQRHSVIDVGPIDVTSPPARLCHENPRLLPADTPKEQLHSSHNRHSPPPFHPPTPESLCPASAELSQMRTEPTAGALSTASEGLSTKPAGFVAESPPSVHLRTTPNSSGPSFAQRRDSRERSQTMPPNHSTEPFAGTDTDLRTSPEMPTVRAQPPPSVPAFQPTKRNASCCRVM